MSGCKKMIMKRWFVIAAALSVAGSLPAQNQAGGLLLDKDLLMPSDLVELSQTQFNFGTARAMAMAGAFTSLGADLSSMTINPAGLGMYRHTDFSITPMMTFSRAESNAEPYGRNHRNRFSMANVGGVSNVYEGSGKLVSVNVGIGYNRIADLNYDYSYQRSGQRATIGNVYARLMDWSGKSKNDFYNGTDGSGNWNWDRVPVELFNAALAYRGFLIDQTDSSDPSSWKPTWVGQNADIGHFTSMRSRGSIGEYAIAVGFNFANKFYLGATLGLQSVSQHKYLDYGEEFFYGDGSGTEADGHGASGLDYQLLWWKLNQRVIINGVGVNFKVGFIYRPVESLRIGVAFHTPTHYSLNYKFQSAAAGLAYANNETDSNVTPDRDGFISTADDPNMTSPLFVCEGENGWSFATPARLLFGVSYAFGNRGVISVDYERDWYNGIRMKKNPVDLDSDLWYNDTFRDNFKGMNILRLGAEYKPLPFLALRAGFGYSGSMLKDNRTVLASPVVRQTTYCGAGVGFVLARGVLLDVAYQYLSSDLTDYYLFYAEDSEGMAESARYSTTVNRHNLAVTLGFRF